MISQEAKKGAVLSGMYGVAVGASAASVGGYVGLQQACKMAEVTSRMCNMLLDSKTATAMTTGALVGASIGCAVSVVSYSAYKSFMGWCYPTQRQPGVQLVQQETQRSDEDPRVSVSVIR
jgi:hypothetical protein